MRKASWVLLTVVGALILLGSFASLFTAYKSGAPDAITPSISLEDVAAGRPEVATAIRARRATAAAFAAAYAVLFLSIVLGPYRHGDAWSWWSLLAAAVTLGILIMARVPALGTRAGSATGLIQLVVVVVALLLDVRRVRVAAA
jgi:uncharacterized membrane protein (DUF2068 family)